MLTMAVKCTGSETARVTGESKRGGYYTPAAIVVVGVVGRG